MQIAVVGLSHKTAPVEVREKVAFPESDQPAALQRLLACPGVTEGMIMSTCNRVEVYAVGEGGGDLGGNLAGFLAGSHAFPTDVLRRHLYLHTGEEAVRHLMKVSSSLDSMVLGEAQILGQVKEAFERAQGAGATGRILNELMKKTYSAAKTVRTDTGIARSAVSISSSAVELARKIFNDLAGKTVMIIGAGEMSELAVRHLIAQGATEIMVANRTFERAVELAKTFNGSAIAWEELAHHLVMSDIVISSTGAPHFILTVEMMRQVIHQRKHRPMFLIDIAVPRDIDPKINDLDNVYLYDIDDLESVVEANLKERQKEAEKAEAIIQREVGAFTAWINSLQVVPAIVALRRRGEEIRDAELAKALQRLGHLSSKDQEAVRALASGIVNKLLHGPVTALKREARGGETTLNVELVRELFGLAADSRSEETSDD
jgi:glutamyl-tRNA reductase